MILKPCSAGNMTCDWLGLSQILWTCVNHRFNGSNPTWWEFEERLSDASSYITELGFSLQLRQEQNFSVKELFKGGYLLAVLPTGFGKSLIFLVFWLF